MKPTQAQKTAAEKIYPGAATDAADNDKASKCEVKQETRILNNNPNNQQ